MTVIAFLYPTFRNLEVEKRSSFSLFFLDILLSAIFDWLDFVFHDDDVNLFHMLHFDWLLRKSIKKVSRN